MKPKAWAVTLVIEDDPDEAGEETYLTSQEIVDELKFNLSAGLSIVKADIEERRW